MSSVTYTPTAVKTSTNFHNPFSLLAALNAGASVRCARCQKLTNYDQAAVLRSRRRRAAIAICRTCAQGGAA